MKYIPEPINTENIELPDDILLLAEKLAKHTHDVWAVERMKEGWTYGQQRDDTKKEHPCLVPYEALPESEKEYDRNTSQEVLKVLYAFGYRIVKP